ncbi:MAG: SHOCT domain-containing protein [Alphaproteobacteria bacterium GM7ARS4]|nr:SHOCT domain-containing protein [Alphaproteobacteria bacterium GM7ARS4]
MPTDVAAATSPQGSQVLWTKDDFFVRLEPQDRGAGGKTPPPNDHPFKQITAEGIVHAFSKIVVQKNRDDVPQLLFSQRALDVLATYLVEGLEEATPRQDVTFAVKSWHEKILTFSSPVVLTGRVFMREGQLNLILGEIRTPNRMSRSHAELSALNRDIRLYPYIPGKRFQRRSMPLTLSVLGGEEGIYTAPGRAQEWLIFSPQSYATLRRPLRELTGERAEELVRQRKNVPIPVRGRDSSQEEVQRLRDEVSRLKDDSDSPEGRSRAAEQRLEALERMRKRGLISEDEYEQKRKEAVQGL